MKPFLSKRNNSSESIILSENSKIVNNQKELSEIMNDYYIIVAKDIGQHQNIDVTEHLDRVSVFGSVLTDVPPLRQGVMHVLRWLMVTKTLRCYLCPEQYQNCSLIVSDTHK